MAKKSTNTNLNDKNWSSITVKEGLFNDMKDELIHNIKIFLLVIYINKNYAIKVKSIIRKTTGWQ